MRKTRARDGTRKKGQREGHTTSLIEVVVPPLRASSGLALSCLLPRRLWASFLSVLVAALGVFPLYTILNKRNKGRGQSKERSKEKSKETNGKDKKEHPEELRELPRWLLSSLLASGLSSGHLFLHWLLLCLPWVLIIGLGHQSSSGRLASLKIENSSGCVEGLGFLPPPEPVSLTTQNTRDAR